MAVKDNTDQTQSDKQIDGNTNDSFPTLKNASVGQDRKHAPQKSYHNTSHGGQPFNPNNDKYNEATRVSNDSGPEAIKTAREKFAKNGDVPSGIASAASKNKTISKALNEVDGQKKSQVLKQMYEKFGSMQGILNLSRSGQQGSSSETPAENETPEPEPEKEMSDGTKDLLILALTGALEELVNKIGYSKVIAAFNTCLTSLTGETGSKISGYDNLRSDYKDVISQSLINLAIDYKDSGGKKLTAGIITIPKTPTIPKGSKPPIGLVSTPPEYAIQKFYSAEEDPYPGYIQWENIDGSYSYTVRGNSPAFETSDDAIVFNNQVNLLAALIVPVSTNKLDSEYMIEILDKASDNIDNQSSELLLGNTGGSPAGSDGGNGGGGGSGGGSNMAGMAQQLLPKFQSLMTKAQTTHLPKSVLDNGKVNKLMENFQKKKVENKRMAMFGDMAVQGGETSQFSSLFGGNIGNMMGVLGNIQSLVNIGGKTKGIGGLQNIVSSLSSGGGI